MLVFFYLVVSNFMRLASYLNLHKYKLFNPKLIGIGFTKKNMINKIIFCSDFLMTKEKEQFSNLKWLSEILKRPIKESTGFSVECFTSSLTDTSKFSREKFFLLSKIKVDIHKTQFYFDDYHISPTSISYLNKYLDSSTLVIGYEISENTRNILSLMKVNYIDIWLHPIRYLDDVLFGFSSNNKEVFKEISRYNIDEYYYWLYADRLKIGAFKGWKRVIDNIVISKNSALFIGQTLEDKAVCKDGKMLNLLDFKIEFERLGKEHSKVYYSRHPFVGNGDKDIIDYVKQCPFAEITNYPSYYLLAHPNISKVSTISSSVAFEAKYFGKQTEFLFKPVIEFNDEFNINSYISIFQDFISPKFWGDILNPIIKTKNCKHIKFHHEKDKIRDMLGFYWNYKHLDKIEYMREWIRVIDNRIQRMSSNEVIQKKSSVDKNKKVESFSKLIKVSNQDLEWKKIIKEIDNHDVISFDIFDTLIIRDLRTPNDIFDVMHPIVNSICDGKFESFRKAREESRSLVDKKLYNEEVLLIDRYDAIQKKYSLTESQKNKIYNIELEFERKYCRKREFVYKIYQEALKKNKKIIIVSDIFFPKKFVAELLDKCEIDKYLKLFVSSEYDSLKHSGNLYNDVLKELKIHPSKIIHFGDNFRSDFEKAKEKGIDAFYIPRTIDDFNKKSLLSGKLRFNNKTLDSHINALIANKLSDNPFSTSNNTFFDGEISRLGYGVLGPMFFGFTNWLAHKLQTDSIDRVYFLSRDGDILKKCYDIVVKNDDRFPKSTYLLASRRSVNTASIQSKDDIKKLFSVNFSRATLKNVFYNRIGFTLQKNHYKYINDSGFNDITDEIVSSNKEDVLKLNKLIEFLSHEILDHINKEKRLLLRYYQDKGLFDEGKFAVVDIGHNGSLQLSISKLIEKNLTGYYFATYKGIKDTILDNNMNAYGYVGDSLDGATSSHPYCKNILMFEMAFLNEEGSFVHFKNKGDNLTPVFLSVSNEKERVDFAKLLHKGIVSFISDLYAIYFKSLLEFQILSEDAIRSYVEFLESPNYKDASAFLEVSFENKYSCRDRSFLLTKKNGYENSLWKKGAISLKEYDDFCKKQKNTKFKRNIIHPIVFLFYKLGFLSNKKYTKFIYNPYSFFEDSRLSSLKEIY